MVKKAKTAPQKRKSTPQKAEAPSQKKSRTQKTEAAAEGGNPREEAPNPMGVGVPPQQIIEAPPMEAQHLRPQREGTSKETPQMTRSSQMNEVAPAPQKRACIQKEDAVADLERGTRNDDIVKAAEALRQMRGVFPKDGICRQKNPPHKGGSPQEETSQAAEASHQIKNDQTREVPDDKASPQVNLLLRTRRAAVEKGSLQVASFRAARAPQKVEASHQKGPHIQEDTTQKEGQSPREAASKGPEAQNKEVPQTSRTSQQGEFANPQTLVPEDQCHDWMLVFGNAHYARDRNCFTTYRPLGQYCPTSMSGQAVFVAGVGTVELKAPSSPDTGSPVRTLILVNVLHVPSALCNGFSFNVWAQAGGYFVGGKGASAGYDQQMVPYWYTQPFYGSEKLVLDGNPQGKSFPGGGPKVFSSFFTEGLLKKIHDEGR